MVKRLIFFFKSKEGLYGFLIALSLFMPSTSFVSSEYYAFFYIFAFVSTTKISTKDIFCSKDVIIVCTVMLILINLLTRFHPSFPFKDLIIPIMFMANIYFVRLIIKNKTLLAWLFIFLLLLVCIEVLFGIYLKFTGYRFFKTLSSMEREINLNSQFLYYKRVAGLSGSSSSFGLKILLAYMISFFLFEKKFIPKKSLLFIWIYLAAGLYISFNRTAILSLIFYCILICSRITKRKYFVPSLITLSALIFSLYFLSGNDLINLQSIRQQASFQFLRGKSIQSFDDALTDINRFNMWQEGLYFLSDNLFLGNRSKKKFVDSTIVNAPEGSHYHNSFIQFLVNHGCIISFAFFFYLITFLSLKNYYYIFTFFCAAMLQNIIFWGISLFDIVFYIFLFQKWETSQLIILPEWKTA
jgi:hypothetical protein